MDRSFLKREYKRSGRSMGVYAITHTAGKKVYLGYGIDVRARLNRHRAELTFGKHRNRELQEAWDRWGEEAFLFEVLDVLDQEKDTRADPTEDLRTLAEMWIKKLEREGYGIERL